MRTEKEIREEIDRLESQCETETEEILSRDVLSEEDLLELLLMFKYKIDSLKWVLNENN